MKRVTALLLLALVTLAAAACSGTSAASASPAGSTMDVQGAWARAASAGADTAVYFTVTNRGQTADALTGVSTDIAQSAGLHQTTTDPNGMTGMQPASNVVVTPGGMISFAPGSYHVMLTGLKRALNPGDTVQLTLTFQNAGAVKVTAEVRAN